MGSFSCHSLSFLDPDLRPSWPNFLRWPKATLECSLACEAGVSKWLPLSTPIVPEHFLKSRQALKGEGVMKVSFFYGVAKFSLHIFRYFNSGRSGGQRLRSWNFCLLLFGIFKGKMERKTKGG